MYDFLKISDLDRKKIKTSCQNYRRFAGIDIDLQLIENQLVIKAVQNRLLKQPAFTHDEIKDRASGILDGINIGYPVIIKTQLYQNG